MKFLVISDVVEPALYRELDPEPLADIDLVISCGDLPPEYLSYLVGALQVPLYYVRGNHDIRYDDKPPEGATDIHGRLMAFQGLRILGIEGSRWYNGGPHQYEESEMKWMIRKLWWVLWLRGGVDIVVTHAPPAFHSGCRRPLPSRVPFVSQVDQPVQPALFSSRPHSPVF